MIKTIVFTLLMSLSFTAFCQAPAQEAKGAAKDCDQFMKVFNDAKNQFKDYSGEETGIDYFCEYHEYGLSLWNDDSRECVFDFTGGCTVSYSYCSTKDLNEAYRCYNGILKNLINCLPVGYHLYSEKQGADDELFVTVSSFRHENDMNPDTTKFEHVFVSAGIYLIGSSYYIDLTLESPNK